MNNTGPSRLLLADLLQPRAILPRLTATDRDSTLRELVAHVPELAANPAAQETLFAALKEREQLHSTGIGDGVALPHSRNALVGLVDHPILVFGRNPHGIAYGSVDGQPARLFFLLVAPTVTTHLQMLSRISRVLRDARVRQALLAADSPEGVIGVIREAEFHL
jgi:mannitol/fructose-specific phosphotransferase system IIA component (Ntr-type)